MTLFTLIDIVCNSVSIIYSHMQLYLYLGYWNIMPQQHDVIVNDVMGFDLYVYDYVSLTLNNVYD